MCGATDGKYKKPRIGRYKLKPLRTRKTSSTSTTIVSSAVFCFTEGATGSFVLIKHKICMDNAMLLTLVVGILLK